MGTGEVIKLDLCKLGNLEINKSMGGEADFNPYPDHTAKPACGGKE